MNGRHYEVLTKVDLDFALDRINNKHKRIVSWFAIGAFTCVSAGWMLQSHRLDKAHQELGRMSLSLAKETNRADVAERHIKNITELMKINISGRKLGKPIRISGDLIVGFAGEVRE